MSEPLLSTAIVFAGVVLLSACGSRADLSVYEHEVGDQTHVFVSYRGNFQLARAYRRSIEGTENDDIWYRFEFPTSMLRSAHKHSIDLAHNPDVGVVLHLSGPAIRVGPTGSNPDVQAINGRLELELKLLYNPNCQEGPIRHAFRIKMSGNYQATVNIHAKPTAVDGSLHLDLDWP